MVRKLGLGLLGLLVLFWLLLLFLGGGGLGRYWGPREVNETPIADATLQSRAASISDASGTIGVARPKQILFGDLHVHSTYSLDAFMMALPTGGGEGLPRSCPTSRAPRTKKAQHHPASRHAG